MRSGPEKHFRKKLRGAIETTLALGCGISAAASLLTGYQLASAYIADETAAVRLSYAQQLPQSVGRRIPELPINASGIDDKALVVFGSSILAMFVSGAASIRMRLS